MAVNIYRYDDPSAPILSTESGNTSLITVLTAALVTGYGSKAPAGWTKPFSSSDTAVFRQGGGNQRYLQVSEVASTLYAAMRGYVSMSGVSSGDGPFPSIAQLSGGISVIKGASVSSTARPWIILATNKTFYLWVAFGYFDMSALGTSVDMFGFGDIISRLPGDALNTFIIGREVNSPSSSNTRLASALNTVGSASIGHYLSGSFLQDMNSMQFGALGHILATSSSAGSSGMSYPDYITGGLLLDQIRCTEPTSPPKLRGHLPGIFNPLHNQPGNHLDVLQGSGSMAGTDIILFHKGGTAGRVAFSLNEAHW